ncbi:MAG: hypothetical protein ACLP01_09515, partial [Solirubrobacteraceae bacterium]
AIPDDIALRELVEVYWRLHAVPNLAKSTRDFYKLAWVNHIMPRLGDYPVRELSPKGDLYLNQVGLSGVSVRKQALSGVLR